MMDKNEYLALTYDELLQLYVLLTRYINEYNIDADERPKLVDTLDYISIDLEESYPYNV